MRVAGGAAPCRVGSVSVSDSPLATAIGRLSTRAADRSEATIQSDIRLVLLTADLGLDPADVVVDLEVPAGGGRIDILIGRTVIEVKRDLTIPGVQSDALQQLAGYLRARRTSTGGFPLGVLTDGVRWDFTQLAADDTPTVISTLEAPTTGHDPDVLIGWLRAIVGRTPPVPPTPTAIEERFGAGSLAHQLDAVRRVGEASSAGVVTALVRATMGF